MEHNPRVYRGGFLRLLARRCDARIRIFTRVLLISAFASSALAPAICVAGVKVTAVSKHPHVKKRARDVVVLEEGTPLTRPYRILGTLFTEGPGPHGLEAPTFRYWADMFRSPASKLGADAVIGLNWSSRPSRNSYWAGGLAVAYLETADASDTTRCAIAILSPDNKTSNTPPIRAKDSRTTQIALEYVLERKGYFAHKLDIAMTLDSLMSLSADNLDGLGGKEYRLLFLTTVQGKVSRTGVTSGDATFSGVLFSKDDRDVVWSSTGKMPVIGVGSVIGGATWGATGLAFALVGEGRESAVYRSVEKMVASLPAFRSSAK